jgi:hypothetical protein
MRHRAFGRALAVSVLALVLTQATPRTGSQNKRPIADLASSELAVLSALQGSSGGVVTVLSSQESRAVSRMRETPSYRQLRSPFTVLMRGVRQGPGDLRRQYPVASARQAFPEFAAGRQGWVAETGRGGVAVVRNQNATFCSQVLRRRLTDPVEAQTIYDLIARSVRSATGAKIPGGFIGSCAGENDLSAVPLSIPAGEHLDDALNRIVEAFGASVWVAVQDSPNNCAIGLVNRATTPDRVCTAPIVDEIAMR